MDYARVALMNDNLRQLLNNGRIPFDNELSKRIDNLNGELNNHPSSIEKPISPKAIFKTLSDILNSTPIIDDASDRENRVSLRISELMDQMVNLNLDTTK